MTIYDIIMLMLVLYAAVTGWSRGMAWQIAPIASLVLGYLFAMPLSSSVAPWFGEPPLNRLFALITMYCVISLAVYLLVRSIRESLEKLKLEEFDRHLGFILGAVKGLLFTIALTLGLVTFFPSIRPTILQSESSTIATRILHTIYPILPTAAHEVINPYLKNLPPGESYLAGSKSDGSQPADKEKAVGGNKEPLDTIRDLPAAATDFLFGDRKPSEPPQQQPATSSTRPRTTRPTSTDIPQIIQDGEFLAPPELPPRRSSGRTTTGGTAPGKTEPATDDDVFPPLPPARTSSGSRDRF